MCGLWCTYDKKGFYCGREKYAYYLCSANKETKRCSSHRIPEKDLEDAVLVMLKQHIQNILHLKRVLEFVGTVPFQEINMKKLQDRLEKKNRRQNVVRSYG